MYTSFFGLHEKPFAITPDPRYLFMSERHGEGLAHLLYGVTDSGGFIQLTGEVGTGKTTLVRTLLGQLPEEVDVALILNPQVTVVEFLQAICQELGVDMPADRNSSMALVDALNRYLLDAHAKGRRIILLVDEAQNLSSEVLEQLRLLTNLETARQKLLQIILIGQPELRDILAQNHLRQLAQRVTGRYHLEPLSREETARYVEHRMRVAGGIGEIFENSALREVHRISGGVPRIINVICDRALLGAFSRETRLVDRGMVRKAAREVAGEEPDAKRQLRTGWKWAAGITAVLVAAATGFAVAQWQSGDGMPTAAVMNTESAGRAGEPVAVLAVATEPARPEVKAGAISDAGQTTPSLESLLASGDLESPGDSAMNSLLDLWEVEYATEGGGACEQAAAAGLSCLWQRGSWSMMEQLDLPAVLTLTDRQGNSYDVVLTGLDGDSAELQFGDRRVSFPVSEVSELWFGRYLLLWRPLSGHPRAITPGMRGPEVLWLRRSLAELEGAELPAEDAGGDFFDDELESMVRAFQRRNRLRVDGLAGEQTQIIINSALARESTPRLSGDS